MQGARSLRELNGTLNPRRVNNARSHAHIVQRKLGNGSATLPSIARMNPQEIVMNKDQVKGRIKEAQGKVKEVTGKIVGNKRMEEKGLVQKVVGKVQAGYGDFKDDVKNG
jgi:uncharacterized protein YjbJ (UPF0337 family)